MVCSKVSLENIHILSVLEICDNGGTANIPNDLKLINNKAILKGDIKILCVYVDAVDGKIARKFNQVSNLGKLLDPVADKLTIFALAIVLFLKFKEAQSESMQAFAWVFLLFIAKDIIMILGSVILIALGTRPVAAEIWGKLATFVFYAVMVVIIGFGPEIGAISMYYPQYTIPETFMFILVVVAVVLTFIAFFSYLPSAIKQMKENSKKNK